MASWRTNLRQAREAANLTRIELARRAGVSAETIGSYETGRRSPKRPTLGKVLDALPCDAETRSAITRDAGFPDEPAVPRQDRAHLEREIAGYTWPCLVLNDRFDIVSWSAASVRVGGRDFATMHGRERNMMRVAADPHFRSQSRNWSEIVSHMVGLLKIDLPESAGIEALPHYFQAVALDIAVEHPASLQELARLWEATPPQPRFQRNIYRPAWETLDDARLSFNAVVTTWSDYDALHANDWQPADAATWSWLSGERGAAMSPDAGRRAPAAIAADPGRSEPWWRLLKDARETSGLTQAQAAERSGWSVRLIGLWENGHRRPDRDSLLHLLRAIELDGALTNEILLAADLEPIPSDWACLLAGMPRPRPLAYRTPDNHAWPRRQILGAIDDHDWPCLVVGETCDIVCGNRAASRVLGFDLGGGRRDPQAQNVLGFLLSRTVRDRVVNWPEVATALIPRTLRTALTADSPASGLRRLVAMLERDEPDLLAELRSLWAAAPQPVLVTRTVAPLIWRHADGTALAFNVIVAPWNCDGPYWSLDWHPADADTWRWFGR